MEKIKRKRCQKCGRRRDIKFLKFVGESMRTSYSFDYNYDIYECKYKCHDGRISTWRLREKGLVQ